MDQHETMELNTGTIRPGQAARGGAAFLRFAAAVLVALSAAWARGQGVAPVNPAFREWQKRRAAEQDGAGRRGRGARDPSEADEGFGLVPALVDMNYLSDINAGVAQAPAGAEVFFVTKFSFGYSSSHPTTHTAWPLFASPVPG